MSMPAAPAAPPARRANMRIVAIDVVRGLAILWVILYHLWTDVNSFQVGTVSSRFHAVPDAIADLDPIGTAEAMFHAVLRVGYLGVPLFMILSGLSLTLAAARRELELRSVPGFLRRRFRRVLVPYWFGWAYTVLCFALIALWQVIQFGHAGFWHYWWEGTFTIPHRAGEFVTNPLAAGNIWAGLLLVPRIIRDEWQFAPEGSLWFVLLIVQYYLLFPFLLVALRRVGAALFLTGTLLITLVSLNLVLAIDGNLSRLHRVLDMGSPFRLFEFGLGMTAGYLLTSRPGLVQRAARGVVAIPFAVGGAALVVIGSTIRLDSPALSGALVQPMVALGLSLLFLPLAFKRPGRLERGLAGRAVAWVGVISYAVLIANEPLRHVTLRLRLQGSSFDVIWVWLLYLPLTFAIAWPVARLLGLAERSAAPEARRGLVRAPHHHGGDDDDGQVAGEVGPGRADGIPVRRGEEHGVDDDRDREHDHHPAATEPE
jgi:peptidoglycan/LPS O-acetylase OafA/YrhL